MDQDEVLEPDTYLDGGSASDAGMAFGQKVDSQSEDMDITAQPSEAESYSGRPMERQDARHHCDNPGSTWGEGENETAKRRRLYPKVWPYTTPAPQDVANRWYQGEDVMVPNEMPPPLHAG